MLVVVVRPQKKAPQFFSTFTNICGIRRRSSSSRRRRRRRRERKKEKCPGLLPRSKR
tara:strand:+ start:26 stop:196 length:171 start_codon:yes stop_codon:yes gene_type:complete